MVEKKIGQRIQKIRKARGYTQEQFAEIIGCTTNHLSAIERGISSPRVDRLILIMNTLKCSADELFQDVISYGTVYQSARLNELLSELPVEEQNKILAVVEIMIRQAGKKVD